MFTCLMTKLIRKSYIKLFCRTLVFLCVWRFLLNTLEFLCGKLIYYFLQHSCKMISSKFLKSLSLYVSKKTNISNPWKNSKNPQKPKIVLQFFPWLTLRWSDTPWFILLDLELVGEHLDRWRPSWINIASDQLGRTPLPFKMNLHLLVCTIIDFPFFFSEVLRSRLF